MIDHRAFAESLLQPIITRKVRLNMREGGSAFVSEQKFQLPKLDRLMIILNVSDELRRAATAKR